MICQPRHILRIFLYFGYFEPILLVNFIPIKNVIAHILQHSVIVQCLFRRLVEVLDSKLHSFESAIILINESCSNSVDEVMSTVRVWVENAVLKEKNKAVSNSINMF